MVDIAQAAHAPLSLIRAPPDLEDDLLVVPVGEREERRDAHIELCSGLGYLLHDYTDAGLMGEIVVHRPAVVVLHACLDLAAACDSHICRCDREIGALERIEG